MNTPASDYRCYRHPDREAYISCQRCERLICPECMREASVGFQCSSCVNEGAKTVRAPRTAAGGVISMHAGRVSTVLIAINVIAYILTQLTGGRSGAFFQHGELAGVYIADGQFWRMLTSAFLHNDLWHLLSNMLVLFLFGPFVERALGTFRFIAAYVTSAIVASAFVYVLTSPYVATIGASGAVFGLFGMALMLLLRAKEDVRTLLVLLAINAVISFTNASISWQGHLGGFIAGVVLGAAFAYAPRDRKKQTQLAAFAALWIGVIVAVALRTNYLL